MTKPGDLISFMGLEFETNTEVLTPRAETELLGRIGLDLIDRLSEGKRNELRVIDMCCGSGNLACALAYVRPEIRVWASDLTDACVSLARRNVARHSLEGRVQIRQGDLFASLADDGLLGTIDLVVCNPPYISSGKLGGDSAHLLDGQPREAFDGGPYGFSIHKRVITDAPTFLKAGGWLAMEMGLGQERQIGSLFARAKGYEEQQNHSNDAGAPRAITARFSG